MHIIQEKMGTAIVIYHFATQILDALNIINNEFY